MVWLLRRNISTIRPCDKLDHRKLGPFRVIRKVGRAAYRLELPPGMRIHPTFHVSLLEKYKPNTHPERTQPAPPPPVVQEGTGEEYYEPEDILDSRVTRTNVLEYFIKWRGYPADDNSWGMASDLEPNDPMVLRFHLRHPEKPGYQRIQHLIPRNRATLTERELRPGVLSRS